MRSVVVPTYNEEERIERAIQALLKLKDVEIIISDDGSNDKTKEIAKRLSRKHKNIRVIVGAHSGKGGALIRGFNSSKGDVLGFLDADLSAKPTELEKVLEVVESGRADLAIGSRELSGSVIPLRQPIYRRILGISYSLLARALFGVKVKDFQCGCKAFRRELWSKVNPRAPGFVFDTELIALAGHKGFKIEEVPITWTNDRRSKVHPVKDPLNMLTGLLKIKWRLMRAN
jgi:glycosyltransferase involved in cell wall biosynthesis